MLRPRRVAAGRTSLARGNTRGGRSAFRQARKPCPARGL